jgi:hypothetical protein
MMLLTSSVLLFQEKIGFSLNDALGYYNGNMQNYISAKTYSGILKIILPHIFGFGLFVMVVLHFLVFTKHKESKKIKLFMIITFIMAFLELFSPFFIISGAEFFAYVKIASFIIFEIMILYVSWLLFSSIIYD